MNSNVTTQVKLKKCEYLYILILSLWFQKVKHDINLIINKPLEKKIQVRFHKNEWNGVFGWTNKLYIFLGTVNVKYNISEHINWK